MDKKYIQLFQELVQATANAAEQVMDYDRELKDEEGLQKAQSLRDDFLDLKDKLDAENPSLEKADYAKLLIGTYIITNHLRDRIKILQKSISAYEKDLIPKLQKIVDASDEDMVKLIEENFTIDSNE